MTDVAIFLMDLDGGGAERVMLNLARGFAEQGLKVDLVLVKAEGPYSLQLPQLSQKVRVIKLENSRLILSLPALARYLKQEQPPVLISALEDTNMIALWARRLAGVSTQVIVTVHNHLSRAAKHATKLKHRLTPQFVKWFYPRADTIVAVSQGVAEDLVDMGLPSEKIKAIYNPIVTPEFSEKLQESVDHPWFSSGQPPVILGVGRLDKQKDFPTLIHAFARVRQQHEVRLMILGEGNERSHLESLAQSLGLAEEHVVFPGFVANPYAYMAQAAVLVLSSAWEGFGNVLVEALAAGTPIVSTDCESGPAEILANGQYGKLVAVGDSEGMAKAIAQTLEEAPDSKFLQERADEFSLKKALTQYQQLLPIK
ncbi:glycosyltransferase [Allocoleopsis sp.]|uniref:glycosyltransferase n=1 Tax=Allocoleopsis sp. TaxID=3088169 RepID=UPI0032C21FE5